MSRPLSLREIADRLRDRLGDMVNLYWAFEEARSLGFRMVKLHVLSEHELSLVLYIRDYDLEEVEVLGVRIMMDKSKVKGDVDKVRKLMDELAAPGETFYAESSSFIQMVIRCRSLGKALKTIDRILEGLRSIGVDVDGKRFIGYSFMEEEA